MNAGSRRLNLFVRTVSAFSERAADLVCPPVCIMCGKIPEWALDFSGEEGVSHLMLCHSCRKAVTTPAEEQCPRCASAGRLWGGGLSGCSVCHSLHFSFDEVVALGSYTPPLSRQILLMKKDWHPYLSETFAGLLADVRGERLRQIGADYLIPIPMHHIRRFVRSLNSAERIADVLSRYLEIPVLKNLVCRSRWTPRQAALSRDERLFNVKGAFKLTETRRLFGKIPPSIAGKKILVVDDVLTTGATSGEVARILKEGGAKMVSVAVLART